LRGRWRRINVQKIGRGGRELPSRGASRRSHREPIATPVWGSPTLYPAVIFGPGLHVIDMNEALGVVTEVDDPRWLKLPGAYPFRMLSEMEGRTDTEAIDRFGIEAPGL
jgi:hypothetical protein